jgi:Zn-dependent M28 family amino/carboxypeptidase
MDKKRVSTTSLVVSIVAAATLTAEATAQSFETPASLDRLLQDLSVLAHDSMEGRAPGTQGSVRARTFLIESLTSIGAIPLGDSYEHGFETANAPAVNIIAAIPGRDTTKRHIVLTAHYDHEGVRNGLVFNGADDNASGVAAALAIARDVAANPLSATLVIALVDAEESGLLGAREFVARPPMPRDQITLNVNLDMVARTAGLLWAAGAHHTPALRPVIEQATAGAPVTVRQGHDRPDAPEGDNWTNASDHAPFHQAGIPFVYFGVEDHADYHRATDDFENVDPDEYLASVRTILTVVRALDEALPSLEAH